MVIRSKCCQTKYGNRLEAGGWARGTSMPHAPDNSSGAGAALAWAKQNPTPVLQPVLGPRVLLNLKISIQPRETNPDNTPLTSIPHKYREMLELPPLLPAVHLSFSAGTSIPVSNSFCHFPSKKPALVSVVPPPYLNMTHMNAGHGKAELLSEVQEAGLKFF